MWRLCKLGYRHEPRLMLAAFVLSLLAALPDALLALWLMLLGDGVLEQRPGLVQAAAIGLGVSATATWFLRTVSTRVQRRFRDKVTIALESHVARLQASVATIAHQERPDYLDRLSMLRNQVFVLDHMYMSLFSTCGWILRLGVTIALLVSIHPALVLLAVFALPTVLTSTWRPGGRARGAGARRAGQPAGPAPVHDRDHRAAGQGGARHRHRRAPGRPSAARRGSAGTGRSPRRAGARRCGTRWRGRSSAPPTSARSCSSSSGLGAPAGDVLLVLAAGARLSAYIGATVGEIGFLRGFWMDGSRRLAWLEDYAASLVGDGRSAGARRAAPTASASSTSRSPIPGTVAPGARRRVADAARRRGRRHRRRERRRQDDAGQAAGEDVRADVGRDPRRRHAARARCRPTTGARAWPARSRTSSASSSAPATPSASATCRASTTSRRSSRRSSAPAPTTSSRGCRRASTRSSGRPGRTASRCRSASGRSWRWRAASCAIAPLLLVLDEPTAALDAETEHALFERYAAAARGDGGDDGRITHPRLAPLLDRAHGRSHRRPRRRAAGRSRHPRRADGGRRAVRRALRHPGRRVPLRSLHVRRTPSGTSVNRRPFNRVNFVSSAL